MSPSGSRKMFPAWSRAHACYAPVAPAWFPTLWKITIEHVPIGPVQIGDRVPHSHCTAHIAFHIQVSEWRAWQADGACMIDVPTLAEVSTQPCKAEKDPLPWMLHVQSACTKYMVQRKICRSRERPIWSPTHTGARRFFAPYSKLHQGRGQSTSHSSSAAKPHPPFSASLSWRDVSEVVPQPCSGD